MKAFTVFVAFLLLSSMVSAGFKEKGGVETNTEVSVDRPWYNEVTLWVEGKPVVEPCWNGLVWMYNRVGSPFVNWLYR